MSVKAMTWVWEHSLSEGAARLVLLKIADHAGDDGTDAYPGQKSLADACRISVRSVRRHIEELVGLGELSVEQHGGPERYEGATGRRTNRYSLPRFAGQFGLQPSEVAGQTERVGGQNGTGCRTEPDGLPDTAGRPTVLLEPPILEPPIESSSVPQAERPRGKPGGRGGWAAITKDHALYEQAQAITDGFWKSQDPKPAMEFRVLRGLVAEMLYAGWAPIKIDSALRRTKTFTSRSLEFALREARPTEGAGHYGDATEEALRIMGAA
jgi:hypothetical protein